MRAAHKAALLKAADACRGLQVVYKKQERAARKQDKDLLFGCSTGAGACAVELEALAGLSLREMTKRAVRRSSKGN